MNVQPSENGQPKIVDINDLMQATIIAIYLVQKMGQPTLKEIQSKAIEALSCRLDGRTLKRALIGASRRELISVLQTRLPDAQGGAVVDCYSMKNPQRWKAPPEYAHILTLLPRLLATPELAEIKGWFDKQESDRGDKEAKARRGNDIDDYHNFEVLVYTTDILLGSQIHCPHTDYARGVETKAKKDKDEKPEMEGIFVVDELTGDRLLTPDCLNGWFTTNAGRYGGMQEARGQYMAFRNIRIPASVKPIQLVLPVNNQRQGASAPKSYEAIPAGQILRIEFTAPTKGLFSPDQYEKLFHIAGNRPRRGFSPARGKRYGHFIVIGFKDLGPAKTSGIEYILSDLPPALKKLASKNGGLPSVSSIPTELTEEHWKYVASAVERLRNVEIRQSSGSKSANDDGPFPAPNAGGEEIE